MLRDLFMAAVGAASGIGFLVIAFLWMEASERVKRRREFTGGETDDFTATMRQTNDNTETEY